MFFCGMYNLCGEIQSIGSYSNRLSVLSIRGMQAVLRDVYFGKWSNVSNLYESGMRKRMDPAIYDDGVYEIVCQQEMERTSRESII